MKAIKTIKSYQNYEKAIKTIKSYQKQENSINLLLQNLKNILHLTKFIFTKSEKIYYI